MACFGIPGLQPVCRDTALDIRRNISAVRVVRQREDVDAPFQEVFKARLDGTLSNLL